ncbi:uncharacterized protein LOC143875930 [Tasmannia lanceolata]|uniref:uncharacterized protein LOC143875930 n=1 Tax=Tasmannia lanceolata TaxID=3420 RepID=UPI004063DE60
MEAEKENLRIQIAAEREIIQKEWEAMRRQEGDKAEMEKEELRKYGEKRREEEDMEVINVMSQAEDVGFVNEAVVTGASDVVNILDSPEGKAKRKRTEKLGSIERRVKNQRRDRKASYAKSSPYTVPPVTKKKSERATKKVTRRRTDLIEKLKKQDQSRILMTVDGVKVLAEDLETLWNLKGVLSGQVLDVYGKYLCASRNALTGRIVYIPSSVHGYKTSGRDLMDDKHKLESDRLANELLHRTVDHIPSEDIGMILIPCCQDFHWALVLVDMVNKKMVEFNSMEGDSFQERASPTVALMKEYLKGRGCNIDDFPYSQMDGFRKQNNGVDCGAFVLKAIEHLYHGQPLNFGPTDIPEFRLQLCERFLRGEFGDCTLI